MSLVLVVTVCLQVGLFALGPALAYKLAERFSWIRALGPVAVCYVLGIGLANLGLPLAEAVPKALTKTTTELTVVFAIPLLLFATDFPRWLRLAPVTLLSFGLLMLSVVCSATVTFWWLGPRIEEASKVSGMLSGMFIGGAPNFSAIGAALQVKKEVFVLVATADVILGGAYLFFLISLAKPLCRLFLPPFRSRTKEAAASSAEGAVPEGKEGSAATPESLASLLASKEGEGSWWKDIGVGVGVAGVIVGGSVIVGEMTGLGELKIAVIVLVITTLGIGASFVGKIRGLRGTSEAGEYLLLSFCIAIGSMVDGKQLLQGGGAYFVYTMVLMFGAIVMHFALAAVFRIDVDTAIITSTAGIFGPPFVIPVVSALRNREVLVSGLSMGILGLAVANYIGIPLGYWLASWGGR